jgi:DinB superfamily
MRRVLVCLIVCLSFFARAQEQKPMTLKAVLLEQLRSTHNKAEWFVPANTAVAGLTPAQASWTDKSGNHSVGQLANHLVFWDREMLAKFKGETPAKFDGNNDETFNNFDAKSWETTVKQLDQVMTDWETRWRRPMTRRFRFGLRGLRMLGHTTPITLGRWCMCGSCRGSGIRIRG